MQTTDRKKPLNLTFIDELPPSGHTGRKPMSDSERYAAALRRNKGKWAAYFRTLQPRSAYAMATQINKRQNGMALAKGGYEAAVRQQVLYVRYVG
jgi:hypothetical protein